MAEDVRERMYQRHIFVGCDKKENRIYISLMNQYTPMPDFVRDVRERKKPGKMPVWTIGRGRTERQGRGGRFWG